MGLTNVFDYLWVIENTVNHVVVVLRTCLEGVPRTWSHELGLGQLLAPSNQNY